MPHSHSIPSGPFDFPWPTQSNGEPLPRAPNGENWPTGPDGKPLPSGPNGLRWPTGPNGKPLPVSPMGTPWPVGPNGGLLPSGPGVEPWPKGWPRLPHIHILPVGPFQFPTALQPNVPNRGNWPMGQDGKPVPNGPDGLRWPIDPSGKPLPLSPTETYFPTGANKKPLPSSSVLEPWHEGWPNVPHTHLTPNGPFDFPWPVQPNGLLPSGPGVEPWPKGWPRLPHIHILPIGPFDFPSHGLVDGNPDLLSDMKNHKPTSPPWYPTTIRTVELNWTTPSKPDRLYFGPTRMGPLAELVPFEPPKKNGPDSRPVTPSGKHMRPQFPLWDSNGSEKKEANDAKPEVGKDYSPLYSPEVCEDKAPREVCEMVAPICIDTKAAFILEMIKCDFVDQTSENCRVLYNGGRIERMD
ncbi:unnamed protein product [Toxocara canis]|uniref:Accumulation-associated protein n=1 Tax=Toxocara canis TaxID=6265 RepID=A0A183UQX7_TOXCA|nr:unnamed protein product [Toxocara canis]